MFDRLRQPVEFGRELKAMTDRAELEAHDHGSPQIESEHLLLAMVGSDFGEASRVLGALCLSRARITEAVERERVSALALAGIDAGGTRRPRPLRGRRRLRWGRSAMLAVERSIGESPDDPALRILMGIVHAEAGVMPRLLVELGVTAGDVEELIRRDTRGAG